MTTRLCRKCGANKPHTHFRDGHQTCKDCKKAYDQAWRAANRERDQATKKRYYQANIERTAEQVKSYRKANPERLKEWGRKSAARYRLRHPERVQAKLERWRAAHPDYQKKYSSENQKRIKAYRKAHAEEHKLYAKRHYAANKKRYAELTKQYREQNAEIVKRRIDRWRELNWENVLASRRRSKARRKNAEGTHTARDIRTLWLKQNKRCAVPGCNYPISDQPGKEMYHVDHVVPLIPRQGGEKGTDWPENLQILCRTHNLQKNNHNPAEWELRMKKKGN